MTIVKDASWKRQRKEWGPAALGQYAKDMHAHLQAWYEACRKGWDAKTHVSKRLFNAPAAEWRMSESSF